MHRFTQIVKPAAQHNWTVIQNDVRGVSDSAGEDA